MTVMSRQDYTNFTLPGNTCNSLRPLKVVTRPLWGSGPPVWEALIYTNCSTKKVLVSVLLKQRSHDERQSRTHFYFVAPSLNTSFCVSASWQTRRFREKSFSVNWSSRLRVRIVENASSDAIATPL